MGSDDRRTALFVDDNSQIRSFIWPALQDGGRGFSLMGIIDAVGNPSPDRGGPAHSRSPLDPEY